MNNYQNDLEKGLRRQNASADFDGVNIDSADSNLSASIRNPDTVHFDSKNFEARNSTSVDLEGSRGSTYYSAAESGPSIWSQVQAQVDGHSALIAHSISTSANNPLDLSDTANPADWPVKVLDYNELRDANSGLVDIDQTVEKIRHSRHVRLGVWCAVVVIVCLAVAAVVVPSAMNFPAAQRLLAGICVGIVGVFVVFTIPLFKWAQYPDLTMEERARLSDAHEIAMDVRRVAASDLKRSYGFVDIMAEKDVLTAVKRGDMMVKEWKPGRSVDFFECPKDGRNRDFRIFYRKTPLPEQYAVSNATVDHGNRCILQISGDRARIIPEDPLDELSRTPSAGENVRVEFDDSNGASSGKFVSIGYLAQDEVALRRAPGQGYQQRFPLKFAPGFSSLVFWSVLGPFGLLLRSIIGLIVRALIPREGRKSYCFRDSDRFFVPWLRYGGAVAGILLWVLVFLLLMLLTSNH